MSECNGDDVHDFNPATLTCRACGALGYYRGSTIRPWRCCWPWFDCSRAAVMTTGGGEYWCPTHAADKRRPKR